MPLRSAKARWEGSLREGKGTVALGSGAFEGSYSFESRFEEGSGTNPEELLAAAHAGCFAMALSAALERAGFAPERVEAQARARLERIGEGFKITRIDLTARARVPGIDEARFAEVAEQAKNNCPLSQALQAVEITLDAALER
ncbi:OsmC family protein [Thermoleophilum album]|uniref:Osmotically inducible protein OsmC n=1 Tax=Thermoleophilum album TaxID=29539 RepID=A0A1H6FW15_THEAL|nr:OsmC family protein [Thermoleophilum album]SEH14480.1 osmotically inducible protein OsmC [Thermoleophilum album]